MPQLRPSSLNIGRKKREPVATEGRPTIIIHCKTKGIRPLRDRETLLGLLVFAKNSGIGPLSSPASGGVRSVSLGLQKNRAPRGHTTCSSTGHHQHHHHQQQQQQQHHHHHRRRRRRRSHQRRGEPRTGNGPLRTASRASSRQGDPEAPAPDSVPQHLLQKRGRPCAAVRLTGRHDAEQSSAHRWA